jgi:hypothetical protein
MEKENFSNLPPRYVESVGMAAIRWDGHHRQLLDIQLSVLRIEFSG